MLTWHIVWFGVTVFLSQTDLVTSHGHLFQPAQRSSAWRVGYNNPINNNDNQLNCGGFGVQWNENDGRCGVCGDPFNAEVKPNEDVDGKYVVNGVITGSYVTGQVMTTKVKITAYQQGWFEFSSTSSSSSAAATTKTKHGQACSCRATGAFSGVLRMRMSVWCCLQCSQNLCPVSFCFCG